MTIRPTALTSRSCGPRRVKSDNRCCMYVTMWIAVSKEEPIGSYERGRQPTDPQVRLLSVSAGASLQGAARNPRANPHENSISLGQGWSSGGCSALVSCAPNRKSGPLIPSLSFPPPLTKVLPAQVARSARRRSTLRLHERARQVWRRGTVHSVH